MTKQIISSNGSSSGTGKCSLAIVVAGLLDKLGKDFKSYWKWKLLKILKDAEMTEKHTPLQYEELGMEYLWLSFFIFGNILVNLYYSCICFNDNSVAIVKILE